MSLLARRACTPPLRHQIPRTSIPASRRLAHGKGVVDLAYELVAPSNAEPGGPLVILHGIFGSKQNWRSMMKSMANTVKRRVYAVDLRNHGISPHNPKMDYTTMANDMLHFFAEHKLRNVCLLGHSMGGKVAMSVALSPNLPENTLDRLISVDMTPATGSIGKEVTSYIEAMMEIEAAGISTKKEADVILQKYEPDLAIRSFLLTNLVPHKHKSKFRIPVQFIKDAMDGIGDFPYKPGERKWQGKTLFIKGEKSKYINRKNLPIAQEFFPNSKLETLDTGHWVHAEQPHDFIGVVNKFIREVDVPT